MAKQPTQQPSRGPAAPPPQPATPPSPPAEQQSALHAALHRLASFSGDVRTLAVNITILTVIIIIVPVIGGQFLRSQVLIEPIAIPAPLLATGLTPEVAANRLWDGIKQVTLEGNTAKGAISAIPETQKVDFSIPDSGLSIDSLVYYVRQFFHIYETHVSGEFRCADPACTPQGITLRLRIVGADLQLVDLPPMGARSEAVYFHDAAHDVLAMLDPFIAIVADADRNPDRAKVLARRLIRSGHQDAKWAHNLIGNLLLRAGDTTGALKEYEAALAIDPDFLTARANYGDVHRILGDIKGARDAFERIAKADPKSPLSQAGFADLAMLEGKPDDAVRFLMTASDRVPLETKYIDRAGKILLDSGRNAEAEAMWERALEINPVDLAALAHLGAQHLADGEYGEAERLYQDAADYAPDDATLQGQDAELLLLTHQYDAALVRADNAIRLAPDNAGYRISRASALQYLERYDQALQELVRAEALAPDDPKIFYARATMQQFLGRNAESIAAFRRFLALDPETPFAAAVEGWISTMEAKLRPAPAAPDQPAAG